MFVKKKLPASGPQLKAQNKFPAGLGKFAAQGIIDADISQGLSTIRHIHSLKAINLQ